MDESNKEEITDKESEKEEFKKYGKIRGIGHADNKDIFSNINDTIYIQEKMDGANFRWFVKKDDDGNKILIFGSRTQQLTSNTGEDTNVAKNFKKCVEFVREKFKENPDKFPDRYIYYGECMVKHTMDYNWQTIPPLIGFDIYCIDDGIYEAQPFAKSIFNNIGIEFVPIIKVCKADEAKEFTEKDIPVTKYPPISNPNLLAEGVVFKNYDYKDSYNNHMFAKLVRAEFKEENAMTFGGSPKYGEDDSSKIVLKYCTNARIDKCIFKLHDSGIKIEMKMMEHLPKAVTQDIYEEHWQELLNSNYILDMKKIRKQITRRCLMVLQQVITNNEINKVSINGKNN